MRWPNEDPHCVYILASGKNGTLYVGVTHSLTKRMEEHQAGLVPGFTARYNVKRLVYFEAVDDFDAALAREKAIKKWNRKWKIEMIERDNPGWNDLTNLLD